MTWAIPAALFAALGSSLPAVALLRVHADLRRRWIPGLVAFAAGTLLAAGTIDLLPEALADGTPPRAIAAALLAGLLGFVALDLGLAHRHGHAATNGLPRPAGALVLVGDGLHNFADGIALAAAFAVSRPAGIAATIAVLAHELPQQLGNVALLLESGWSRRGALWSSIAVNLSSVAGAAAAGLAVGWVRAIGPFLLAVAAAGFLYVAAADLIPTLQHGPGRARFQRAVLLFLGTGTVAALHLALG